MPNRIFLLGLLFFIQCDELFAQKNVPLNNLDYSTNIVEYKNNEIHSVQRLEQLTYVAAVLSPNRIGLPLYKWALLKSKNDFCAIRFTEFSRAHENDNNFSYSKESFQATYQCLCSSAGVSKFNDDNFSQKEDAYQRPNIWRFERKSGIRCGSMRFGWHYPTGLIFSPDGGKYVSESALDSSILFSASSKISDLNSVIQGAKWIELSALENIIHNNELLLPLTDLADNPTKEQVQK